MRGSWTSVGYNENADKVFVGFRFDRSPFCCIRNSDSWSWIVRGFFKCEKAISSGSLVVAVLCRAVLAIQAKIIVFKLNKINWDGGFWRWIHDSIPITPIVLNHSERVVRSMSEFSILKCTFRTKALENPYRDAINFANKTNQHLLNFR